jgi:hypothetical protein
MSMQRKLKWLFVIGIVGVAAYGAGSVLATPPSGASALALAPVGHFAEIDAKAKSGDWEAEIETKGLSDVHVTQVTIQPGGTFGWHSHPGPSFVIVKSGTATFYEGDDPTCTGQVLPTGSTSSSQPATCTSPGTKAASPWCWSWSSSCRPRQCGGLTSRAPATVRSRTG